MSSVSTARLIFFAGRVILRLTASQKNNNSVEFEHHRGYFEAFSTSRSFLILQINWVLNWADKKLGLHKLGSHPDFVTCLFPS